MGSSTPRRLTGRLRRLTRRQAAAASAVVALEAAVAAAALTDRPAWASAFVGLLGGLVFVAVLQLRRRVAEAQRTDRARMQRANRMVIDEIRALKVRDNADRLGAALSRVVEATEKERRSSAGRQHDLLAALERERLAAAKHGKELLTALERGHRKLEHGMIKRQREQLQEVEALLQLFRDFSPRAPMPSSGHWAISPTGLLDVLHLIEQKQPKVVLEIGSGTSTIWMAYALEKLGGRLVSVDHDPGYAERTRTLLRAHGLDGVAEVRLAALRPLTVHGEEFQWYDTDALADVNDIDLLLVDGPPGATGPIARYPAVPVLLNRLSSTAAVVLDDMVRQDEQEVVRRWTSTVTGLAREREFFDRVAVLRYSRFES